jgi:tetratricopeptide (TPR) repeat protein
MLSNQMPRQFCVIAYALAWLLGVLVIETAADVKQCTLPFAETQPALCTVSGTDRARMYFEIGIERVTKNSITEAIAAWDEAIAADPKFIQAYVAKADWLIHQNKFALALPFLEQAYRRLPRDPEIAYMLGKLHAHSPWPQAAFQYFSITLRQKPDHVMANYEMGLLLEEGTTLSQAAHYYERAGKLYNFMDPPHLIGIEPPFVAAARAYYRMNMPEKALFAISRWFAAAPAGMLDGSTYEARGRILERLGRYSEAAEDFTVAITELPPPMRPSLVLRRAIAYQRSGKSDLALTDFESLLTSGDLKSILQLQVYLRSHGYRSVRINGKSDSELRTALAECLQDPKCGSNLAQRI